MRAVTIQGGGLAGLSLARALAQRGVPVTVLEKGRYPRHKVCGEFITGLDEATRRTLALDPIFEGSLEHHTTVWYRGERVVLRRDLPTPAIGLSRWTLDARLAEACRAAGAKVHENVPPGDLSPTAEGWVRASGVRQGRGQGGAPSPWVGLKAHLEPTGMAADLELHLGRGAYVGLSPVEGGRRNLCLLVHRAACPSRALRRIEDTLRAVGLAALAERAEAAGIVEASRSAVAGFRFGERPARSAGVLELGDAGGMIPPFTGHGMAMAFQSAALAVEPLVAWSAGHRDWPATAAAITREEASWHTRRTRVARLLHPWLLRPRWQALLCPIAASPVFPFRTLYALTHS